VVGTDLKTAAGLQQQVNVLSVVRLFPELTGPDTVYLPTGTFQVTDYDGVGVYGSFTVSVNGSGTLAVTATAGAAVATGNTIHFDLCDLNRVRITPNAGDRWYVANVVGTSSSADVVALGDGSYTLGLYDPSGNFTSATFRVSLSSGLSATQLPQGSPLVTLALVPCAPTVGPITAPLTPVPVNTAVGASASFTDPDGFESQTAVWTWGDGSTSAGIVTESSGAGSVSGSHAYTVDGVYTLTLTVTDDGGASGQSTFSYMVVYNASAGFVTGGGWITSPAGAYVANPALTGKANFGFNAKYHPNSTVPEGDTEFQFSAANLNFHTTSYDWLVITSPQAQYQGTGTINGAGNYGFLVTGLDGKQPGAGGVDKFRMKIWDKNNNNAVVYDTQQGAAITAPPTTPLGGGDITVHSNGNSPAPPGGSGNGGTNKEPLTPLLLDGLFAAGLETQEASLVSQYQVPSPSPVGILLTAREVQTSFPNRQLAVIHAFVGRMASSDGMAGWVDSSLEYALLDHLAGNLGR